MSNPPRTIRRDTRVFISAVTRELGSIRKLVKKGLEDNDYHAVEQDNFHLDYCDLKDKLHKLIDSCDAVIHIAGNCYGFEPKPRPDGEPQRSYTQLEYEIAVKLGKPIYLFLTSEDFPAKRFDPEPPEIHELQKAHRQRLTSSGQDYCRVASKKELDQKVRSLRLKVEQIEGDLVWIVQEVVVTGRRLQRRLEVVAVVVIALLGVLGYFGWHQRVEQLAQRQEREKQESERILAEAARKQIETIKQVNAGFAEKFLQQLLTNKEITAEDARQRALKELPALVNLPPAEIESLINRKIPRATETSLSPLEKATVALAKGDYDAVDRAWSEQDRQGRELAMLAATANLARFRQSPKPEWNARALAAFRRAMALADPNSATAWEAWTDAASSAAVTLIDVAQYAEAEALARDCLRLRESRLGAESVAVAISLNNLAEIFRVTNRKADAEPLTRRALAIKEKSYGPDHPDVAVSLNNLALLLQNTNRLEEAETLYRRALAINERSTVSDQSKVARDLNNLAGLLELKGRLTEAEALYRRALAIDEKSYGPDHPDVALVLNNLAGVLGATSRQPEAEALYRRALAINEKSFGPDHLWVAINISNLAQSLRAKGWVRETEPLYRRALAIFERSYGPNHPNVAIGLDNLAVLLQETNRMVKAEPLFRRALTIDERSYGTEHPAVARDLNYMGGLLRATTRPAEAEALYRRALTIDERSFGPDHPDVARDLNDLAGLLRETSRPSEAEALYRRALAIDEKSFGPDHPKVARDLNGLAILFQATNRPSQAETLFRRSLAIDERACGPDHHEVALRLHNLAVLLCATNRQLSAEPLLARSVGVYSRLQRATGDEHPLKRPTIKRYLALLTSLKLAKPDMATRIKVATRGTYKLSPIVPEVDMLLGPPRPLAEVLSTLDRQYKDLGMPALWFLPLDEPIAPHLDQFLGPTRPIEEVLNGLGEQYRTLQKPAAWFLSLDESISPHLDEYLGKLEK